MRCCVVVIVIGSIVRCGPHGKEMEPWSVYCPDTFRCSGDEKFIVVAIPAAAPVQLGERQDRSRADDEADNGEPLVRITFAKPFFYV